MIDIRLKSDSNPNDLFPSSGSEFLSSKITNWRLNIKSNAWHPPTDLFETDDNLIVSVEIPGMDKNNFSISYEKNILSISGIRVPPKGKRGYHQMEIKYGEFCSQIKIPLVIDIDNIEAVYQDGFLNIKLPKSKPTHIDINKD